MKLAFKTFKRNDYTINSKFGYRNIIKTSNGTSTSFHTGTDYGTGGNKWAQYALEDGKVTRVFTDSYGAKCVYIEYPRIKKQLFYAHLDKVLVKKNQAVNDNTIIGYTGMSGLATGIHLHLGLKDINGTTWLDPEKYDYEEGTMIIKTSFLGSRGYIKLGDQSDSVAKISAFMYNVFPAYTSKKALGNYYGKYIEASIKEFQKRTGLVPDGCVGPKTLAKLKEYGFKEK